MIDRELIERLAREVAGEPESTIDYAYDEPMWAMSADQVQALAALVAEECAKVVEDQPDTLFSKHALWRVAAQIRSKFGSKP